MRTLLRRVGGPVPLRHWVTLAVVFTVSYVWWRWTTRMWTGDALYYTAMTYHYAGHSLQESIRLTGVYFHDPKIGRLHLGFDNPRVAPLIYPRVVYPAMSVPFVMLFGGAGMYVVPLLSAIFTAWGLTRLFARLFPAEVALAVAGLFLLSTAFRSYGAGLFTEAPTLAFVTALLLLLPIGGRRFGPAAAAGCALLLVAITFCRQSAPVLVSAVCAACLWTAIRQRSLRGNPWTPAVLVLLPVGLAATAVLQWWAPYDVLWWYAHINHEPSVRVALHHLPRHFWHNTVADSRRYFKTDAAMMILWVGALVSCLTAFRSERTALFLGALVPSAVVTTLNGVPSSFRYYVPMYPILLLAAAGLVHQVAVRRGPAVPVPPPARPARELAGTAAAPGPGR